MSWVVLTDSLIELKVYPSALGRIQAICISAILQKQFNDSIDDLGCETPKTPQLLFLALTSHSSWLWPFNLSIRD